MICSRVEPDNLRVPSSGRDKVVCDGVVGVDGVDLLRSRDTFSAPTMWISLTIVVRHARALARQRLIHEGHVHAGIDPDGMDN